MIHAAGLGAGVVFALGFLAALVGAVFTGGFTVGGLLVTTSACVSAGAGFMSWDGDGGKSPSAGERWACCRPPWC